MPQKFVLYLSQILHLRKSNWYVALQNVSTYFTWRNIRKKYKNNKLKVIVPTWSDELKISDGSYSVSDIQDYIEYIIKKHETLTTIPPIHVYINKIKELIID